MPRRGYKRYHGSEVPSETELYSMYLAEGKTPSEATKLSKTLHREMDALSQKEVRLWKKVREHEYSSGLNPVKEDYL